MRTIWVVAGCRSGILPLRSVVARRRRTPPLMSNNRRPPIKRGKMPRLHRRQTVAVIGRFCMVRFRGKTIISCVFPKIPALADGTKFRVSLARGPGVPCAAACSRLFYFAPANQSGQEFVKTPAADLCLERKQRRAKRFRGLVQGGEDQLFFLVACPIVWRGCLFRLGGF